MFFRTQVVDKPEEPFYRTAVVSEIVCLPDLPDCHCDNHERGMSGDITGETLTKMLWRTMM